MIQTVKIQSGVLKTVLKSQQEFNFSEGLNVIWGQNGAGKSLLLKTIADYCFVDSNHGGGWSSDCHINFNFSPYEYQYKNKDINEVYEFNRFSKIITDWNGDAVFYMHHDDMIDQTHIMGYEMNGSTWIKGIGKIMDNVFKKQKKHVFPSSGEIIKGITKMLLNIETPDLTIDTTWKKSQSYDSDFVSYIKYLKKIRNKKHKPTLLLDEIDSQLDTMNQIWFHEEIIPKLLEKYQIILVSHSIFALKHKNIIDLDGSSTIVKEKIKNISL